MMKRLGFAFACALSAITSNLSAQDHGHLNVGAVGTNQNDQLIFDNGRDFTPLNRYIKTLTYTNGGRFAGYFQQNITLTALPATAPFGGPSPNAPAVGSTIYAQLVSVVEPPEGAFGFWETGVTNPTINVITGSLETNFFKVSENDGSPGADPYGHFHGRRFTATKPGIYTVAFRAVDFSTNGVGGGPIHRPSDVLKINFQAGINIVSVTTEGSTNRVTFGSVLNSTFYLEANDSVLSTKWVEIGSVAGTDTLQTLIDVPPNRAQRFYRVRMTTP